MDSILMHLVKHLVISSFILGGGAALTSMTWDVAKAAAIAHQQHKMSYAKLTRALLAAKPTSNKVPSR